MEKINPKSAAASQNFIEIEDIKEDIVVLKGGQIRAILMCSSINFDLKSQDEQKAIIFQFQNFLNGLDFPFQFLIHSRKLSVDNYLKTLEDMEKEQTLELLKIQTREYMEFIKSFVEMQNIMTKIFYVIIPYGGGLEEQEGFFSKLFGSKKNESAKKEDFSQKKQQLWQRVDNTLVGLKSFGIKAIPLKNEELIELFFKLYNPKESGNKEIQL